MFEKKIRYSKSAYSGNKPSCIFMFKNTGFHHQVLVTDIYSTGT